MQMRAQIWRLLQVWGKRKSPVWGSRWVCRRPLPWRGPQSPAGFCNSGRGWAEPSPHWWRSETPGLPARKRNTWEPLSQLLPMPRLLLGCVADLLLGEASARQLLPAEEQRVGHLSERVQVDEPHPALIQRRGVGHRISLIWAQSGDGAAATGEPTWLSL